LTDGAQYASLIATDLNGTRQYLVFTEEHVAGRRRDGKLLWKRTAKEVANIPTPILEKFGVRHLSYGIGCNLFKVTLGRNWNAEQIYANKVMRTIMAA